MKILIIAEHKNGALSEAAMELFGLPFGQAEVHAVAAGENLEPLAGPLGQLGAAKVHLIDSPALASYTGESLGQVHGQFNPPHAPTRSHAHARQASYYRGMLMLSGRIMGGLKLDLLLDGSWIPIWSETSSNLGAWNKIDISLNDTAGEVIALRFTYETQFPSIVTGLHLDDVIVSSACGDLGGASGNSCAAQDATAEGDCEAEIGTFWNGSACVTLSGCSCVGADCDTPWGNLAACMAAYANCPGQDPGDDEL